MIEAEPPMSDENKAAEFVLGALSPGERAGVGVTRLYDRGLDGAIATLETWLGSLGIPRQPLPADPELWDRIVEAIAEEQAALDGKRAEPMSDGRWLPHGDRIEAKALWDERTALIRCEAGALEPAHMQDEDEHIVVLAGDLVFGGRRFATGDYLFVPRATHHPEMRTRTGCILFVQYRP
jgi:hypothetical protein